jgi:hypothetical protein
MRRIAEGERWIVEGAAGVAVAGLVRTAESYRTFLAAMERGRTPSADEVAHESRVEGTR